MTARSFREHFAEAQERLEYWVEGSIIEFTEELSRAMEIKGITRAELARRIGTSPAYVTKVLRGRANFTLASMVKLCRAVGHDLHLHLAVQGSTVYFRDLISGPSEEPWERPRLRRVIVEGSEEGEANAEYTAAA